MSATLLAANVLAHAAQTTIVIGSALGMLALVRMTAPGARYLFLRLVLAVCLLLPVVAPKVALIEIDDPSEVWLDGSRSAMLVPWQRGGDREAERFNPGTAAARAITVAAWSWWFLAALAAGALSRLAWTAAGLFRLRALRIAGEEAPDVSEYDELQRRIGTRAQIRFVPHLGQPVTFGVRRPVVLLPEALKPLPPAIHRAVLAHELWHVRRYDWGWVLVEELVRAACWFHPAMWLLISHIQAAREETVDELAILATGSRRSYMDALIAFAERPSAFAAAAFARRRHLVQRILMIAKEHVMSSTRVVACSAILVAVVAGASWYAAETFQLTAQAQTPRDRLPPPPPPAPSDSPQQETAMLERVKEQPNAANYHALAVFYFERAFRGASLQADDKSKLVSAGLAASDAALSYDPDYMEALVYKNLLLRLKGQLETDPAERARLVEEADRLRSRAMALRQQQPAPPRQPGTMPPPPPPPPPPPDEPAVDAPRVDGELPIRLGGNIAPPTKIRDAKPVYPPEALANKVEGTVIIEVTIDREGMVRDTLVLQSIPLLDKAAIEAVRHWEFTPTLLNGVSKPVIAVVTINFTLK